MKINRDIAISTPKVLLVPYDRRHVPRYHEWMKDPDIQEATASEPLTLEEEYENQQSWREAHDKLTFILCQPVVVAGSVDVRVVEAGTVDTPAKMIGDINFFLYPFDEDEEDENQDGYGYGCRAREQAGGDTTPATDPTTTDAPTTTTIRVVGEIDIMVASPEHRGQGLGKAAVSTLLHYIWSKRDPMLMEYANGQGMKTTTTTTTTLWVKLELLMVKIKATNAPSIALFRGLGFEQEGGVNYFGEVKLVMRKEGWLEGLAKMPEGYEVVTYGRRADEGENS